MLASLFVCLYQWKNKKLVLSKHEYQLITVWWKTPHQMVFGSQKSICIIHLNPQSYSDIQSLETVNPWYSILELSKKMIIVPLFISSNTKYTIMFVRMQRNHLGTTALFLFLEIQPIKTKEE